MADHQRLVLGCRPYYSNNSDNSDNSDDSPDDSTDAEDDDDDDDKVKQEYLLDRLLLMHFATLVVLLVTILALWHTMAMRSS